MKDRRHRGKSAVEFFHSDLHIVPTGIYRQPGKSGHFT